MKFMITIIIQNSNNEKLIHELNQIINMEELEIRKLLQTFKYFETTIF